MTKARILVVENEGIVSMDIRNTLESLGYNVPAIASSGEEAIKKAEEAQPDLVLMEIVLKGKMSGIKAAEEISNRFDIPVIYLTAYGDEELVQRAKLSQPFGYVLKPFVERELHIAIETTLYKHKIDKKLNLERKQLLSIFEGIDEPIYVADPDTYEILYANKTLEKMFGKDIIGKTCYEVFQHFDKPCDFCTNDKILGKNFGKTCIWEAQNRSTKRWLRNIDRGIRWPDGREVRFEIAIDMTDRKIAEERLCRSEEKYRHLFEEMKDAIYISTIDGKFIDVNQAMVDLLGYRNKEEVLKIDITKDFYYMPEKRKKILDIITKEGYVKDYEIEVKRKDGTKLIILETSWERKDAKENVIGYEGIIRDITEKKKMEYKLRKNMKYLKRFHDSTVDRELKMKELKEKIKEYKKIG